MWLLSDGGAHASSRELLQTDLWHATLFDHGSIVKSLRDRHGKLRTKYRRGGRTIPLRALPDAAEFEVASARAVFDGEPKRPLSAISRAQAAL
jgi:hypothetical protein